ncbi:hypothetical protein [Enterococcus rotai]|nr:hypothetical protein [Enterococcus rotai]
MRIKKVFNRICFGIVIVSALLVGGHSVSAISNVESENTYFEVKEETVSK